MDRIQYQNSVNKMKLKIPKGIRSKRINMDFTSSSFSCEEKLSHCLYLLDNVTIFFDQGKKEKASRYLAFSQAILWSLDLFSINQLRFANKKKDTIA